MRYLILILLVGCQVVPNYETGAGCWRYGIEQNCNTGGLSPTPVADIPVVRLGYDDLLVACGVEDTRTLAGFWMDDRSLVIRSCYDRKANVIYSYYLNLGANNYYVTQERCQALLGYKHNRCWGTGYGIGKSESACDWDL